MQAQTTARLQQIRFHRYILGALAGVGIAIAIIFGVLALTDRDAVVEQQQLSPVNVVQEDPPLPADWVDSYSSSNKIDGYVQEDPPLPEDWVDPYFSRSRVVVEQQDPPLPEGWVDPYFSQTD